MRIVEQPSVSRAQRRKPQDMVPVVEDLIKLLDGSSDSLRRGRYPANSRQIAKVLRVVAEDYGALRLPFLRRFLRGGGRLAPLFVKISRFLRLKM